jgi:hypothetical protein
VYDNGPMNPCAPHLGHWSNQLFFWQQWSNQLESTCPIGWGGAPTKHWRGRRLSWCQVGLGGACLWALGLLSCPLGPNVHVCHHFGKFLSYFLHTNNSTSISGTRWNLNINLHMWWWFSMLLGEMLMVKTGVSDYQHPWHNWFGLLQFF